MTRQLDDEAETLISNQKPESLENTVIGRIDIDHMTWKKSEEIKAQRTAADVLEIGAG